MTKVNRQCLSRAFSLVETVVAMGLVSFSILIETSRIKHTIDDASLIILFDFFILLAQGEYKRIHL